ncbi:M55 family metallopeptidase [Roseisolibacter sp. H3M3-2]|uniref:M55 family metallopeptidase n=1 Tax=Roseisolibacter sp. H3M3-2 TaxID=3031323 RepID=UPI0023D97B71|nr:M55 family metallopeptidase [Roseisolibacter sp. H3M3-2]MDF1504229.1 M55 family metallopeptidase [Roseisolibacter sp. H3M3-2]
MRRLPLLALAALLAALPAVTLPAAAQRPRRVFVSVDMEGIGGIGTPAMTTATGKDYATGRRLMTDEVNAVVAAVLRAGAAQVLVNDSHGDMQNLLHAELDPRVQYVQGSVKPLGMVEGLERGHDAAIFVGYHARAGTADGFLAHTGTGAVKGLWLNDVEVGEGELNALYAGSLGVPVIAVSGDSAFVAQFGASAAALRASAPASVVTKVAMTPQSARLLHPTLVKDSLGAAVARGLAATARPFALPGGGPVRVRLRLADVTTPQILEAIPGVKRVDGYTVTFTAPSMTEAYRMIRLMYKFVVV